MVAWEFARTGYGKQAIFYFEQPTALIKIVVDTYLHRFNSPLTYHVFGLLIKEVESYLHSIPKWMLKFEDGHQVIPEKFQLYMLDQAYLNEKTRVPFSFEIQLYNQPNSPWLAVLPHENLERDTFHRFTSLGDNGPFSHLLYLHYPNGGVLGLKCL